MSLLDGALKLVKYFQPAATTGTITTEGPISGSMTTVTNYSGVTITVKMPAATSIAALSFFASDDSGTTYYPVLAKLLSDTSAPALSFALVASTNYIFDLLLPGAATTVRFTVGTLVGTPTYRITPYADPSPWTAVLIANATLAATQSGSWTVVATSAGDVANGASDSGNPIKQGYRAQNADITAVTNGQRVNGAADLLGRQITTPYTNPENYISGATAAITNTSDTAVIAAAGSGVRLYITQVLVTNSHATVGTVVEIKDGTTVLYRGYAAPAGGGFSVNFPVALRGSTNTALNAANITTGSNVYVSASGYKAAI
jgi:hypothetical protein